jgi:hypothetical protein
MIKKLLIAGVLLTQTSLFAATSNYLQNPELSSVAARQNKKYIVDAQILGLGFSTNVQKIGAGIYMNPSSTLQLNLYSLKEQTAAQGQKVDGKTAGVGSAIEVAYKNYHSNSFYTQFGLYKRTQTIATHTIHNFYSSAATGAVGGDIDDMGINFKIGNQWNWDTFTLGCDWVGYNHALSKKTSGTVEDSDVSGLSLLGFYVGASF